MLTIIRENPKLTQSQIAVLTGRSERSTKRMMKSMMEEGTIERVGGRKYGCWKVKID
ncbi:MAG: winged helix-turn-helix domain-containing protein [Eubacterium sp.]